MTGFESKRQASKSLAANPWREAIDAELVCLHLGTVDSFPTADQALKALIDWHVATALDPEVSSDAQALVDRGATQPQAEPVAWRRYNRSIGWQYEDGVTSFASDPSAEPLYAAPQAQPPAPAWLPIETAPKDGTDILGMYMHIETQIVHNIFWLDNEYEPEENGWWTYEYSEVSRMKLEGWMLPTHWIPLPAAHGIKGSAK